MNRPNIRIALSVLALLCGVSPAHAGWQPSGNLVDPSPGIKFQCRSAAGPYGQVLTVWHTLTPDSKQDLKLQRFLPTGATPWGDPKVILSGVTYPQGNALFVVPDPGDGAIVGFQPEYGDWRIQRFGADGHPLWDPAGLPILVFRAWLDENKVLPLDGGDFVVMGNVGADLLMQRYSGETGQPVWPAPVEVCVSASTHNLTNDNLGSYLAPDGTGGILARWDDTRGVYAQRISGDGNVLWAASGGLVHYDLSSQGRQLVGDGNGGAIVSWQDGDTLRIHLQHLVDGLPTWGPDGVLLDGIEVVGLTGDGSGGAWVAARLPGIGATRGPILVQHVTSAGMRVSPSTLVQATYILGVGHVGSEFWLAELRAPLNSAITAHLVGPDGMEQGAPSGYDIVNNISLAEDLPVPIADSRGGLFVPFASGDGLGGMGLYAGRLQVGVAVADLPVIPRRGQIPRPVATPAVQSWPSTIRGSGTALRFTLGRDELVDLRVVDVDGRVVRRLLTRERLLAGAHEVPWDGRADDGSRLRAGMYFASLRDAAGVSSSRIVLLR